MDKLAAMRAFVEIADRGSLTAAAVVLGKSQPSMVRTLANLETELGVRLIRRTTRRMALTGEGRDYLERCRRVLADIEEAERAVSGGAGEPRGDLRITAPVTFGQLHVAPILIEFLRRYPRVRVELLLLDRVVNFLEEGIDLAVRIGELTDSNLIATKVGTMRRVLVASPGLIRQQAPLHHPTALSGRPCVHFRGLAPGDAWHFREGDRSITVPMRGVFVTNQAMPAVEACALDAGYGTFLAYQVAGSIADGRLQILLEEFEPVPVPVSLIWSDARLMSPSLRSLLDFVRDRLRTGLLATGRRGRKTQGIDRS